MIGTKLARRGAALGGTYATGGLGGQLSGSVVDHLASQGSLGYDQGAGGNGIVDEFAVGSRGSLTEVGRVTVAGAVGGEGIVAP